MLIEEINKRKNKTGILNIVIAGPTCSGKTTLAKKLSNIYSASIIEQDWYFKDLKDIREKYNGYMFDSPNAFYKQEFKDDLETLLNLGEVLVPNYSVDMNKRLDKNKKIIKKDIVIVEGLHTISMLDDIKNKLTIYIDTDYETCLKRRIKRDNEKYNVSASRIEDNFNSLVVPLSKLYIEKQREIADIVLDQKGDIKCLVKN